MPRIVGIDLGTTNSLVAWMNDQRPEILTDPANDYLTGQVIVADGGLTA